MTPLHLAAKMGFKNLVQSLISQHGALLDAMTLVRCTLITRSRGQLTDHNSIKPQSKQTSLHLAAENGQLDVARVLLDMKADVNAMDNVTKLKRLRFIEREQPG
jgi:hypothetical protein